MNKPRISIFTLLWLYFWCPEDAAVTQLWLRSICQSQGMAQSLDYNVLSYIVSPLLLSCCTEKKRSLILELDQGIWIKHPIPPTNNTLTYRTGRLRRPIWGHLGLRLVLCQSELQHLKGYYNYVVRRLWDHRAFVLRSTNHTELSTGSQESQY